jgi:hypothetical protein
LTGGEADLLSRALEEVKTKTFEESGVSLDDRQALNALVSCFRDTEKSEPLRETRQTYVNSLHKRLLLGTIIAKQAKTPRAVSTELTDSKNENA